MGSGIKDFISGCLLNYIQVRRIGYMCMSDKAFKEVKEWFAAKPHKGNHGFVEGGMGRVSLNRIITSDLFDNRNKEGEVTV